MVWGVTIWPVGVFGNGIELEWSRINRMVKLYPIKLTIAIATYLLACNWL